MTKVIKVSKAKMVCDESDAQDYIDVLNGIAYSCSLYDEYCEGNRNTVAVDLTVSAYMLGLDAKDVMNEFINARLIDPCSDDEHPIDRVNRVLEYRKRFTWDWMIDPEQYTSIIINKENEDNIVLWFQLVD